MQAVYIFDQHRIQVFPILIKLRMFIMAALWLSYVLGRPLYFRAVVSSSSFFFFSLPNLSRRRLDVYHTSTHGVALV